ncbi:MAG: ATP-dependent Clp protease ATP-binding subunit ClpC, partial [Actinomycetota bacterium]
FHAGEIIVVDVEDDPESPGDRRLAFRAVEGFVPPSAIELAGVADGSPESETPTSD